MKTNANTNRAANHFRNILAIALLGIIFLCGGTSSPAFAQCASTLGFPLSSFDSDGVVTTDIGNHTQDRAEDLVVQPDGKVVVVGSSMPSGWGFSLARYNLNGSLDATFGNGGIAKVDNPARVDLAKGIALLPNGKIVVVGSTCLLNVPESCNFLVVRLNPNGIRDISFGYGGAVSTDFAGNGDLAATVAVQPDGKIVVGGRTLVSAGNINYALARYTIGGQLDTSFGGDGKSVFALGNYGIEDLVIQPNGKIVAVGSGNTDFAALRLNTNGTADMFFGSFGKVWVDLGGNDVAYSVGLQSDGKIVMGGAAGSSSGWRDAALVRLNVNGSLDNTFNGNGRIIANLTPTNDEIRDIDVNSINGVKAVVSLDSPQSFVLTSYYPDSANNCFFVDQGSANFGKDPHVLVLRGTKIYVAGSTYSSVSLSDYFVSVFETDFPM